MREGEIETRGLQSVSLRDSAKEEVSIRFADAPTVCDEE